MLDSNAQHTLGVFFNQQDIQEGFRLIKEEKLNISFRKGNLSSYFIVSGIIQEGSVIESRISCKSRNGHKKIQSQCSCSQWTAEGHCSHVVSLFIEFHLQNNGMKNIPRPHPDLDIPENIARVAEYGTIIGGPEKFLGIKSKGGLTYFAHQYLLTNNLKVPFPLPKTLDGHIGIKLGPAGNPEEKGEKSNEEYSENLLTAHFSYITPQGETIPEVSLFESLYLFDWAHGDSYYLPQSLAHFIQIVRNCPNGLSINDYLRLTQELRHSQLVVLSLGETNLSEIPQVKVRPQILLTESDRSGFFDFTISLITPDNQYVPIFDELSTFSFRGGLLHTFQRKNEAYEFLKNIPRSFSLKQNSLTRFLRPSYDRERWERVIHALFSATHVECYDKENQKIFFCETVIIQHLLSQLIKSFGVQLFRFSDSCQEEKKLLLQIRKGTLLENISSFFEKISPLGVEIYYNQSQVSIWKPQIQCQRRKSKIDWFEVDLALSRKDLEVISRANLETGHVLSSQGLVLLDSKQKNLLKFLRKYSEINKASKKRPEKNEEKYSLLHLPFERSQIFELFELKKLGLDEVLTEEESEFCEKLLNLKEIPPYDLPKNLEKRLRPYQKVGHNWLRFLWEYRFGACLADDMGLGKTIQTISFLQSIIHEIDRVLIICPVSILVNWEEEFEKFSNLSEDICLYYGGSRELDLQKKIILTSYGVMKKEAQTNFKDLIFDVMILDEVQNLKNTRSLGAGCVRKIKAKFHLCLTGTPVENDLNEFYNILDIAVPGIWGTKHFHGLNFAKKSRLLTKQMARPFILRRTKSQVLSDLPAKVENTVYLRFSDIEREQYLYKLARIRKHLDEVGSRQRYGEVFKGLLELRQLCLWQQQELLYSTKVKFLFKNLEQILQEGHQVLIFSQFTSYLDIIQQRVVEKAIPFSRIDGSYSIKKRSENIKLFQSGKNKVFLISLKAGGLGLNLTAASYIYIMDPWWNPAVEAQAIDRAHRIGQKKSIHVYRLIVKNSVEEKVLELQKIKRQLFDDLMGNENDQYFTGKLSMKDFEALLFS